MTDAHYKRRKSVKVPVKTPASVTEQLEKLKKRGCVIENEALAAETLTNINYYRLAYYFSAFLETKASYREGTTFAKVMRVYDFDRRFRNLLLEVLEEIEISLRAYVSNLHAARYGAAGYLNGGSFDYKHKQQPFAQKIERLVEANADSAIVLHHVEKYGGSFPLWAIMELFSFGMLTCFYEDMKPADRDEIAQKRFGVSSGVLGSWLRCLSELRNHCAHYHRLYDVRLGTAPSKPGFLPESVAMSDTVFDFICVIKACYCRRNNWENALVNPLKAMIDEYGIDTAALGFPASWEELLRAE